MDPTSVPSQPAYLALVRYSELLAAHGPDHPETVKFAEKNKHLEGFDENARQLYELEKEDWEQRIRSAT